MVNRTRVAERVQDLGIGEPFSQRIRVIEVRWRLLAGIEVISTLRAAFGKEIHQQLKDCSRRKVGIGESLFERISWHVSRDPSPGTGSVEPGNNFVQRTIVSMATRLSC
jgi:hypothetical protein